MCGTTYRLVPNNFVLSSLFSAASHAACTPAQLERLWAEFARHRGRGTPSDTVFTSLLVLCQRQGAPERAVDVWSALREVRQPAGVASGWHVAAASSSPPHAWWRVCDPGEGTLPCVRPTERSCVWRTRLARRMACR
jgi:hypothetical protein